MAQALRLKSQKYFAPESFAYSVDVLVDVELPHLAKPYSYAVDSKHGELQIGSIVSVPFGNKTATGIVIQINGEHKSGLKFIKKVIHDNAVVTEEQIELINEVANRWTGTLWSYLKFCVPTIPAKSQIPKVFSNGIKRKIEQPELRIGSSYSDLIELLESRINPSRQLLVIVPDVNFLLFLRKSISKSITEYGSHLSNQDRVANYLNILAGKPNVIIGTRSAIFLPLRNDAEILVVDDLSFSFYESRFPFWNVRDIALIRTNRHSVTFYSHSPSLELARLAETGWVRVRQKNSEPAKFYFKNERFSYQTVIKNGLRQGAVLVVVPEKGYINALVCAKCRNIRKCISCSGRLVKVTSIAKPSCQACLTVQKSNKCDYCDSDRLLSFGKGIDRIIEELGVQFPNVPLKKFGNQGERFNKGQIIVTNYSQLPIAQFSAVILLNFGRFSYQNKLRSSELARKTLFDIKALRAKEYYIDLETNDYFSQAILNGDSMKLALNELRERTAVNLPPEFRIAIVECDAKSAAIFEEQNFISSVTYSGGRALLKANVKDGVKLSQFLQEIANYRSLRKLKPWNVKIDPLDI